jgi:hypothetical protein
LIVWWEMNVAFKIDQKIKAFLSIERTFGSLPYEAVAGHAQANVKASPCRLCGQRLL